MLMLQPVTFPTLSRLQLQRNLSFIGLLPKQPQNQEPEDVSWYPMWVPGYLGYVLLFWEHHGAGEESEQPGLELVL